MIKEFIIVFLNSIGILGFLKIPPTENRAFLTELLNIFITESREKYLSKGIHRLMS